MRSIGNSPIIILFVLIAVVGASEAKSAGAERIPQGRIPSSRLPTYSAKDDFDHLCAVCHGPSGHGDGTVADFERLEAVDLTSVARRSGGRYPAAWINMKIDGRQDVRLGVERNMPVWGESFQRDVSDPGIPPQKREILVRQRIESLTDYIATLQE